MCVQTNYKKFYSDMCLEVTNAVQIEREIGSHIYSNDYGFRKEQGDSLRDRISTEKTR